MAPMNSCATSEDVASAAVLHRVDIACPQRVLRRHAFPKLEIVAGPSSLLYSTPAAQQLGLNGGHRLAISIIT